MDDVGSDIFIRRYRELMELRREGLTKYGKLFTFDPYGVPTRIVTPKIILKNQPEALQKLPTKAFSFVTVVDNPSVWQISLDFIANNSKLLDIGCSKATFYYYLQLNGVKVVYHGLDIDESLTLDIPLFRSMKEAIEAGEKYDVVTMFEVVEHLKIEGTVRYINEIVQVLSDKGVLIVSTPNIYDPTSLQSHIVHIQHYPWQDLYAILRLFFYEVDVVRAYYLCTPKRLLLLLPRILLSHILEFDWCEGVFLVAKFPKMLSEKRL